MPIFHARALGSLCEGALDMLFEGMIDQLKTKLAVDPEAMRANHTNLE